jgi:hypothetical protein
VIAARIADFWTVFLSLLTRGSSQLRLKVAEACGLSRMPAAMVGR